MNSGLILKTFTHKHIILALDGRGKLYYNSPVVEVIYFRGVQVYLIVSSLFDTLRLYKYNNMRS